MLLRIALFVVMAIGLGGFGTVAWLSTHMAPPPPVPTAQAPMPATSSVLAAAHTLRAGVLLKPEDLIAQDVDSAAVPPGARADTPLARSELFGAMLRHTLLTGQVVLPPDVMRAGDRGFLAAVLGPGMRAATVGVDAVSGHAGLIWPGDHVDLILTQSIEDQNVAPGRRVAGETVLRNVRVIAIDQELIQGATPGTIPGNAGQQTRTVTLEVSPHDAEHVAVATRLGHLSLSVISADGAEAALAPAATVPTQAAPASSHSPFSSAQASERPAAAPTPTAPAPPIPAPILAASPAPAAPTVVSAVSAAPAAPAADTGAPITWGGDVSAALQSGRKSDPATTTLHVFEGSADGKEFHF